MRTALVTGANRGLGRAIADRLHSIGHRVLVGARDERAAAETAAAIGPTAKGVSINVDDLGSVQQASSTVGDIDVLINNAGILLDGGAPITSIDPEQLTAQVATNAAGALRVTQAFLPGMLQRGWGRVVMVSSVNGRLDGLQPKAPGYSVSKAALNAITVLLARQLDGSGVLVNAVSPGRVRTRMLPTGDQAPEEAAVGIVTVATLPDDGPNGAFFLDGEVLPW